MRVYFNIKTHKSTRFTSDGDNFEVGQLSSTQDRHQLLTTKNVSVRKSDTHQNLAH